MIRNKMSTLRPYLYVGLVAFIFFFVTESSPIFMTNQWDDTNVTFTMARAWLNGSWPYRDLFEQRGPVLYMLYALAATISSSNFLGLFLVEMVLAVFSYIILVKISRLVGFSERLSFLIALLSFAVFYGSNVFGYGGSPEELAAPIVFLFFYNVMRAFKANQLPTWWTIVGNGVLFAVVFWLKYSLVGYFIGYYVIYGLYLLVHQRSNFIRLLLGSLLGFVSFSAVIMLWFAANNALSALIKVYFVQNLTIYGSSLPFFSKLVLVFKLIGNDLFTHPFTLLLLVSQVIILGFVLHQRMLVFYVWLGMLLTEIMTVYISGNTQWYYLSAIIIFIAASLPSILIFGLNKLSGGVLQRCGLPLAIVVGLGAILLGTAGNFNTRNGLLVGQTKYQIAQRVFGRYIQKHSKTTNPTLIEYNGIDSGFFLYANALPTTRYFEQTNFPYQSFPESYDAQLQTIKKRKVQFVAIRSNPDRDFRNGLLLKKPQLFTQVEWFDESDARHDAYVPRVLLLNYRMVKTVYSSANGESITYMLYIARKKPLKSLARYLNRNSKD